MNFLKFSTLLWCMAGVCSLEALDVTYDLERLTTTHGTVYQEIMVLDSDRHGLLFRHADGIAKLNFTELSTNLRMLYEPVEEAPEESSQEFNGKGEAVDTGLQELPPMVLTARTRVEIPLMPRWSQWSRCSAYRRQWPVHWPRYHPARRLAIPECRALAVKDFLITTKLFRSDH